MVQIIGAMYSQVRGETRIFQVAQGSLGRETCYKWLLQHSWVWLDGLLPHITHQSEVFYQLKWADVWSNNLIDLWCLCLVIQREPFLWITRPWWLRGCMKASRYHTVSLSKWLNYSMHSSYIICGFESTTLFPKKSGHCEMEMETECDDCKTLKPHV